MGHLKYITALLILLMPNMLPAQTSGLVRGTVTDTHKEPLIGCNIQEVDENNRVYTAVITDINGDFSLKVKNPKTKI